MTDDCESKGGQGGPSISAENPEEGGGGADQSSGAGGVDRIHAAALAGGGSPQPPPSVSPLRALLAFRPFRPLDDLPPRWCGFSDAARAQGALLKVLWPLDYPAENAGLLADECAVLFVRVVPGGGTAHTRFAVPEPQAQWLSALHLEQRQSHALQLSAMSLGERAAWLRLREWRRI